MRVSFAEGAQALYTGALPEGRPPGGAAGPLGTAQRRPIDLSW